jgi:hypothetical protein
MISLVWEQPATERRRNYQYRMEFKQVDADEPRVLIQNKETIQFKRLTPSTTYMFRVAAANEVGFGDYTEYINITTCAELSPADRFKPTVPVINFITALNAHEAELQWIKPINNCYSIEYYDVMYRKKGSTEWQE